MGPRHLHFLFLKAPQVESSVQPRLRITDRDENERSSKADLRTGGGGKSQDVQAKREEKKQS